MLQKGRQQSQAGSRSERTEDSGQRDQKTGDTNQIRGYTPQKGPRPEASKIEDINLSDPEEDHIIKDSRYQRKEKLRAHIQKEEENQSSPHTSQPGRLGPPLEPKVIIRQSPEPENLQALKKTPKQEANQPPIEEQDRGNQREVSQA